MDYTGGYDYHQIGNGDDVPDDRPHTFMPFPHCDNCRSTDLFYDFNFVGTTKDGVSPNSHQMVTGWELSAMSYGDITFGRTANRIQWLAGQRHQAEAPRRGRRAHHRRRPGRPPAARRPGRVAAQT